MRHHVASRRPGELIDIKRARVVCGALVCVLAWVSTSGCTPYQEPVPRRDRLNFPIGLALHPTGDFLYVVNSNFDSRYSPDNGGTVAVVDTSTLEIQAEQSAFIPSYGGYVALNEDASKAYVTARRGDVVVALDVKANDGREGGALGCGGSDGADVSACVLSRVPDTSDAPSIPGDPFGIDVTTVTRTQANGNQVRADLLSLTHLSGESVTSISIPDKDLSAASLQSAPLIAGSNRVVRRPGTLEMYVAGRGTNRIAVFVPYVNSGGEVEAIFARRNIVLNNVTSNIDARGIAFSEDGENLYVTTRRPDALHVFRLDDLDVENGVGTRHDLERVIQLGDQPSDVVVHRGADGKELLFIPCYDDRSIQVVDPNAGVLIAEIELDESPYQFVADAGETRCGAPGELCRGYVSLFADASELSTSCDDSTQGCGSVAVIELDPSSPRYLQVISKIR